jgi:hypothetical protein
MSEKMMRVSSAIIEELDTLSEQYGVNRKLLLSAAMVLLRCIMEKGATSIDIVCSDGTVKNIPVPLVFNKAHKE